LLRRLIGKDIDIDINDKELVQNRQKDILIAFGEDLESGKFVGDVKNKELATDIKALKHLKEKLIVDGNLNIYCL